MTASTSLLPRIPLPRYDGDRDKNEMRSLAGFRKRGVAHGLPCIVCNSYTGEATTVRWLHICGGGGTVADPNEPHVKITGLEMDTLSDAERAEMAGCLLFYPVGSTCLRRHKELRPYAVEVAG